MDGKWNVLIENWKICYDFFLFYSEVEVFICQFIPKPVPFPKIKKKNIIVLFDWTHYTILTQCMMWDMQMQIL